MYTSLGLTQKISCWLILVFSWSGLPVQEKIAIDHQAIQELYPIPMEKDTRFTESFQVDLIDQCETKDSHSKAWNPRPSFQYFRSSHDQVQQDRYVNRLVYRVNTKTGAKPMRTNSESLSTFPENGRFQHQSSVFSQAPYPNEKFENVLLPRHAVLSGNGFVVFLLAGSVSYLYTRLHMTRKRSLKSTEKKTKDQRNPLPVVSKNQTTPETPANDIPDIDSSELPVVIKDILIQLHRFEKEKRYLDKEVNLSNLAVKFRTNRRYLSHAINKYKKVSFSTYLKTLRITHAYKRILKQPRLHRFNLEGLADEFGFKSGRSFSIAFSEVIGILPSKLLEELRAKGRSQNGLCDDDS